jgi:hypothetical protein
MDRLELVVQESGPDQQRQLRPTVVSEPLPVVERRPHVVDGRWDEDGSVGPVLRRPDPVLGPAELTWRLLLSTSSREEDLVNFADQALA